MSQVLVIASMIKLKIILPFSIFVTIYVIFSIIYKPESQYSINDNTIEGYIYECQAEKDKVTLKVKGKENIIINYYNDFDCKLGSKIKATGEIKIPSKNTNFNLFNYQNYLLSEKIHYTFTANDIKIINQKPNIFYKIKNNLYNHIKNYKTEKYLKALVLGNDDDINLAIKDSYQINGISHLLAISGTQITLFSCLLLFIFNKIFSKNTAYLLTIVLLIFYLFVTNFQAPILRATLFFIILTINKQFELKLDTYILLIITCGILLILNPFYIYSLGFLLSFVISFFLLIFSNIINNQKNYLTKNLAISLIAFQASAPILINNFFQLNLLSPLINLYFVPIMTFIIYPLALLTFIFKPLDNILFILIQIMEHASLILSNINFLNLTLHHISLLVFILYYILIIFILYKWSKGKNYLAVFFIVLIFHHNIGYLNPYSTMTMLDVGQGDSILIKLKNNKGNILIDTGGQQTYDDKTPYDIAKNITIPYLKSEGIDHLDYLILTHGDFDHAGMAINLIQNFKVNHLILNKKNNELENEITKRFKGKVTNISKGVIKISNVKFNFLNGLNNHNENDDSLIIYTQIENQNILLMGDASKESEKYLLNTYNLPKMDILKVGHHGSSTSSSKEFIEVVSPKISLISAGKNNVYGHPHQITLQTLKNSKIFTTKKDGAIKINLTKNTILTQAR